MLKSDSVRGVWEVVMLGRKRQFASRGRFGGRESRRMKARKTRYCSQMIVRHRRVVEEGGEGRYDLRAMRKGSSSH
jgi:hypothetical protein